MRLANKVAIISGAASGMGAATARIFAREGARVVVADVLEHEDGKWPMPLAPPRGSNRLM
jgi:NAD(P)-dependent dehydrogenase (short-subunit alcohol dehydrogenase family)